MEVHIWGKGYISDHLTLSPTKYEGKSVGLCVDSNLSAASGMTPSGFLLCILAYHKCFCAIFLSRVVRRCIASIVSLSFYLSVCSSVRASVYVRLISNGFCDTQFRHGAITPVLRMLLESNFMDEKKMMLGTGIHDGDNSTIVMFRVISLFSFHPAHCYSIQVTLMLPGAHL